MTLARPRERYVSSGRFDAARLPLVLAWLVGTSAVIAAIFMGLLLKGCYISAISVMFPLITAAAFVTAAVRYLHCRSRLLAGVLGAACGLGGYLAYFHLDQCVRWGAPILAVDRLPGYIVFRLETDQWRWGDKAAMLEPQKPQPGVQPQLALANAQFPAMSWILFLFELSALTIAPLTTGVAFASRPYSEKQRRWCVSESLFVTQQSGKLLRRHLRDDSITSWAESAPNRVAEHQPHSKITVWYAPWDEGTEFDGEVFLSLDHSPRWRLMPEEAAALIVLLPSMQDIVGQAIATAEYASSPDDPTLTRIWPVPAPYAGPKQTKLQKELDQLKGGLMIGAPVAGALLALVGGTILLDRWQILPAWAMPIYVAGIGFPAAFYIKFRLNPANRWEARMIRVDQLVRQMIARRPDAIVHPDDPQSVSAEYFPRRFWEGGRKLQPHETNEGLLRFDWELQTVFFEAENQRISIPAPSILQARIENLPGIPRSVEGLYAVVLRVRTVAGVRELPLFPIRGLGVGNWNKAVALLHHFQELCHRNLGEQPTTPPPPIEIPTHV